MHRKIIHIDMDAFFASIEQRDNPELRGKPVAVGGTTNRGVVAAASYEARKFGVYSAMATKIAIHKCPNLQIVKTRFDIYKKVSKQIQQIFLEYTDLVEPLSLDEAFLDVTKNKKGATSATLIAKEIKSRIKDETGLTASAGISVNKFLAKIASDYNKPDGLYLIPPEKVIKFIEDLDIDKFFGVGKVTARKMHKLGIHKGKDLKSRDQPELIRLFGKPGVFYYNIARGNDDKAVNPDRVRKSIGAELTFEKDLSTRFALIAELYKIEKILMERIDKAGKTGKTLTLKVKYADFAQITRSKTVHEKITEFSILHNYSKELLKQIDISEKKVRLLGLTVSNLEDEGRVSGLQLTLDF